MKLNRQHVVVMMSVTMIVLAGYFQYSYNKTGESSDRASNKGDAVFVSSGMDTDNNAINGGENFKQASKEANEFFSKSKLNKEITRGKNKDLLSEVIKNPNAPKELKETAGDKMEKLTNNSEKEMKIETLLRERGFQDSVVMLGDDGSIDIVVKSEVLSSAQVAQIADVSSRQADVTIADIHIKNMY